MPKKVLILGQGITAHKIFNLLKKNYRISVCGKKLYDYLFPKNIKHFKIDYKNKKEILKICKKEKFNFIIPDGNDTSYLTSSFIASNLGYPGYEKYKNSINLINKTKLYKTLKNKIKLPKRYQYPQKINKFPIICRKNFSNSGKGTTLINNLKDLNNFKKNNKSFKNYVVTDFIQGPLFSHSFFFEENNFVDFLVSEKISKFQVIESFHPYKVSSKIKQMLIKNAYKIISLFKLKSGLLHIQYILKNNIPYLIEVTRRCPGDFYGVLIKKSTNVDYYKLYANNFLNKKIIPTRKKGCSLFYRKTIFKNNEFDDLKQVTNRIVFYRSYKKNLPKKKIGVAIYRSKSIYK